MARMLSSGVYWVMLKDHPNRGTLEVPVGKHTYNKKTRTVTATGEVIPASVSLDDVRLIVRTEMNRQGLPQHFERRRKYRKWTHLQCGIRFEVDHEDERTDELTDWSGFLPVDGLPAVYEAVAQMIYSMLQKETPSMRGIFIWLEAYVSFYKLKNNR